jgi:hypothetical protein
MNNITTNFEEYKQKKVKEFNKTKTFEPLSSDIIALKELQDGNVEKVSGPIEIVQVTGVITDEDRISKLEEASVIGPQFNIAKNPNEIKIGSVIWLTALAQTPNSTSWNSQPSYVTIQTRVVNIYAGLNKLKTIK